MAHEITTADSYGETRADGKKAWHGLGIEIPEGLTASEGFKQIGLGWDTELHPITTTLPGNVVITDPEYRMHVRMDTKESLGIVSKGYKVISNQFMAEFADSLCGTEFKVRLETAGSLRRGRRVFCSIKLPKGVEVVKGDILDLYVIVSNAHDASAGFNCYGSSIRPVCANTLGWSERELFRGMSFAHTGDIKIKVEMARQALGILVKQGEMFGDEVKRLAASKFDKEQVNGYFLAVYKGLFGLIADDLDPKEQERRLEHRSKTIAVWNELYTNEKQNIEGIEKTAWSALNAVTEWSDHHRGRFGTVQESEARVHSNMFGASHLDKRKAFRIAQQFTTSGSQVQDANVALMMA